MPSDTEQEALARAVIDQHEAATAEAEQRWPHNESVQCDGRIELRLLDASVGPDANSAWVRVTPDRVWMVWPATGEELPVPPGMDPSVLAAPMVPRVATCDRCDQSALIHGALLCVMGAKVIALVMCGACACDLTVAGYPLKWTTKEIDDGN